MTDPTYPQAHPAVPSAPPGDDLWPPSHPGPRRGPGWEGTFDHTPTSAAINIAVLVLAPAAMLGRVTHTAPGWALLAGMIMAGVVVLAGLTRSTRPLAARSLIYRAAAMLTAGVWLWGQVADFRRVNSHTWVSLGLLLAAATTTVLGVALLRRAPRIALLSLGTALLCGAGGLPLWDRGGFDLFTTAAHLDHHNFLSWAKPAALTLGFAVLVFAVLGHACASHERIQDEHRLTLLSQATMSPEQTQMRRYLHGLGGEMKAVLIGAVERWDNGAGETYTLDVAAAGITLPELSSHLGRLATRMKLPPGCGIEAAPGAHRGELKLKVARVNRIAENHNYPLKQVRPRTVYNRSPLGVDRAGMEVGVPLRESSMYLWGQKRTGKTGTLYSLQASLGQCTDCVIWAIDLGGGGVSLPFLWAYAEGRVDVPMVDWLATTPDEAMLMAELALRIAVDRKIHYQHRKVEDNVTLLPLDAHLPEIVIILDEGAELMAETITDFDIRRIKAKLEEIQRVAGDSGVNIVFSGLRATADVATGAFLAQTAIRVAMRVTDAKELGYGFGPGGYQLDPDDTPCQGSGFLLAGPGEPITVFKAYWLDPRMMDRIAVLTAPWRPPLDDRAVKVGGTLYADRWVRAARNYLQRMVEQLGKKLRPDLLELLNAPDAAPETGATAAAGGGERVVEMSVVDPKDGLRPLADPVSPQAVAAGAGDVLARMQQVSDAADAARGIPTGGGDDAGLSPTQIAAALAAANADPRGWSPVATMSVSQEEAANPTGAAVLEALVRHHGAAGIGWSAAHRALVAGGPWGPPVPVSIQSVGEWLRKAQKTWLAARTDRQPYVHKDTQP